MQNTSSGERATIQDSFRTLISDLRTLPCLYLLGICVSELIGLRLGLFAATLGHAVLILILYNHAHLSRSLAEQRLLVGMALVPVSRLFSICLPVVTSPLFQGVIVAVLLLSAIVVTILYQGLTVKELGLSFTNLTHSQSGTSGLKALAIQLLIALCGIPLGLLGGRLLHTAGLVGLSAIPFFPAILFGAVEELLYRGVLLNLGVQKFPKTGILFSSVLFMVMNLASGSLIFALWMGVVGLLSALAVRRTHSLFGVILAHTFLLMWMVA